MSLASYPNARSTTGTRTRVPDINPQSGMCPICIKECPVLCEIGLSAFRGREVLLAATGPHGLESARLLGSLASRVYWSFPGGTPGCPEADLASLPPSVELIPGSRVAELRGESRLESVVLETPEGRRELRVSAVFVEMGYTTRTDLVEGFVELNERGEVVVDRLGATSRPGVFAAGDLTDAPYKQAVVAAASGAVAALSAYNYLAERRGLSKVRADWRHEERRAEEGGFFLHPP